MERPTRVFVPFVLFATGFTAIGGFLFGCDAAVISGANFPETKGRSLEDIARMWRRSTTPKEQEKAAA
jgi:hypothetical protein